MFLTGLMSAVKAEMSGWRCSHIGCHITKPLANRKVKSDSYKKGHIFQIYRGSISANELHEDEMLLPQSCNYYPIKARNSLKGSLINFYDLKCKDVIMLLDSSKSTTIMI